MPETELLLDIELLVAETELLVPLAVLAPPLPPVDELVPAPPCPVELDEEPVSASPHAARTRMAARAGAKARDEARKARIAGGYSIFSSPTIANARGRRNHCADAPHQAR